MSYHASLPKWSIQRLSGQCFKFYWRILCLGVVLISLSACVSNPNQRLETHQQNDLDLWLKQQLFPYLQQNLTNKPRFRGRPMSIVKLQQGQVSSQMDKLTASLRQQLEQFLLQQRGISLYRAGNDLAAIDPIQGNNPCMQRPQLYFGIAISQQAGQFQINIRMLDRELNNRWVDGFALSGQGNLTALQSVQLQSIIVDPRLQGQKQSPYDLSHADAIAKNLSYQLKCEYMQGNLPIHVALRWKDNMPQDLDSIQALLMSNLTALTPVKLVSASTTAEAYIDAHWVSLDKSRKLGRLALQLQANPDYPSAEAFKNIALWTYIENVSEPVSRVKPAIQSEQQAEIVNTSRHDIPQQDQARNDQVLRLAISDTNPVINSQPIGQPLIHQAYLQSPLDPRACDSHQPWQKGIRRIASGASLTTQDCFALQIHLTQPAYVFVLAQASDGGWNRLFPVTCLSHRQLPEPSVQQTHISIPSAMDSPQVLRLDGAPGPERLYLFAIGNPRQAQQFQNYIHAIPSACGSGQYENNQYEAQLIRNFKQLAPQGSWQQLQYMRR